MEETTKIYDAAKEVIEQHRNENTTPDLLARYVAEDISKAVVAVYGKSNDARYLLDTMSYYVQGWCNPELN